jgi:integrase
MRRRTGHIQQRGETSFRIQYYVDGVRQFETITGIRADAERELAIRLGEIAKGIPVSSKPNTVLFEELAADVINDYRINGYTSIDDIEARYRLHILPTFGKRRAATITTAQIRAYIVQRKAEGAAVGSVNRELEAIRHTLYLARDGRKLLYAPKVPMLRENNVRTGFFTSEEVDRLCSHLKPPLDSFVRFGFLTGWRYGEIQQLKWVNVDFARGEIRLNVGTDKNRDGRVFPMSEEIRSLLAGLRLTSPFVFAIRGKRIGAFRKQWRAACFKAGLPCIIGTNGKPIKALRTFHDLRRSFAREMDIQGVRHGAIKKLGGWKTDSVFNRYNIVSDSDLRDAMEMIDSARNSAKARFRKS